MACAPEASRYSFAARRVASSYSFGVSPAASARRCWSATAWSVLPGVRKTASGDACRSTGAAGAREPGWKAVEARTSIPSRTHRKHLAAFITEGAREGKKNS